MDQQLAAFRSRSHFVTLRFREGALFEVRETAGEIATARPVCARADMLAAEALALMNRHEISVLPVIDEAGLPLGLLHVHDLLRAGVA